MKLAGPLLQLDLVSKAFPGVQALSDVSFDLAQGEIVAIVGENGAGKSTLLKILAGIHPADRGQVLVDGSPLHANVRESMKSGIRLIHQELNLAEDLTVAENVFLAREPRWGPRCLPFVDRKQMRARTFRLTESVGLRIPPDASVRSLSLAQRQIVEIAKSLSTEVRILVLDEPTSSLAATDADRLLSLVERLRTEGVAILYVSHHLREVTRLADRVIVLRDGRLVGTLSGRQIDPASMIPLMTGRDAQTFGDRSVSTRPAGLSALEVRNLKVSKTSQPISFQIGRGEIVGFAGLVGAGRTELARTLFGIGRRWSGNVLVEGRSVKIRRPAEAIRAGIALVPEDRQRQGVFMSMPVGLNICLAALRRFARLGWIKRKRTDQFASQLVDQLSIRLRSIYQMVKGLSGGNQQKVVLAKWLATRPNILILDEPTRGVDIGAKFDTYRVILDLVDQGMAVMMISSDLEEIIAMSDRVIVMKDGQIAGQLNRGQISEVSVMELAFGHSSAEVEKQHER